MKIINLSGGLGNQMFQYAYGRKLTLIEKKEVIFNTSFFKQNKTDTPRPFLLNKFTIDPSSQFKNINESFCKKFFKKVYSKITGKYDLFQSEKYFKEIKDVIRNEFTLKDPLSPTAQELKDRIVSSNNPISLHVRRGDYVSNFKTNQYHGTCTIDYYEKAVEIIKGKIQSPTFFIFSDDIEWVKENLKIEDAVYVSNPLLTECEELILMSTCSHHIIANSTFSWWGAWLNPNNDKIVIAPKKWTNKKNLNKDVLPSSWLQI